jgi:predicted transglutaminase-like cysteine proteinase
MRIKDEFFVSSRTKRRKGLLGVLQKKCVGGFFLIASVFTLHSASAQASSIKDVPAQIRLKTAVHFNAVASYPRLFDSKEKHSTSLKAFTKWSDMFHKFDAQLQQPSTAPVIQQFQNDLQTLNGLSLRDMTIRVNTMMNAKRYITDNRNWGTSDYWATPVEFLQRGGDCEDFAIAKYTALRALGVPEERLRVAIVHDTLKNIPHAVLVVYTDQGTLVLDNQMDNVIDGDRMGRYRPIYSINRSGWWLHTETDDGTQIASR